MSDAQLKYRRKALVNFRNTVAHIDLDALQNNYTILAGELSEGHIMPVIKADAYGHGVLQVAQALTSHAQQFAVAIVEEGIELRAAGIMQPVVVLEGAFSKEALAACFQYSLTPVIHTVEQLHDLASLVPEERPYCWMKVDIGMHRLGFTPDTLADAWQQLSSLQTRKAVLCGHFSDADETHSATTERQLALFTNWVRILKCEASLANSPAITHWPQSHVLWNRAGISLYGLAAKDGLSVSPDLRAVMSLRAPVISIRQLAVGQRVGYGGAWTAQRPSTIATIAIGYGDGYPRHAPNGTPVLINQQRCSIVGRVSMDMITVDVTDAKVAIGDIAELWGTQLPANEIATHCKTIGYELVTRVSSRVPRIYGSK